MTGLQLWVGAHSVMYLDHWGSVEIEIRLMNLRQKILKMSRVPWVSSVCYVWDENGHAVRWLYHLRLSLLDFITAVWQPGMQCHWACQGAKYIEKSSWWIHELPGECDRIRKIKTMRKRLDWMGIIVRKTDQCNELIKDRWGVAKHLVGWKAMGHNWNGIHVHHQSTCPQNQTQMPPTTYHLPRTSGPTRVESGAGDSTHRVVRIGWDVSLVLVSSYPTRPDLTHIPPIIVR